jgi:hypothetical protein
MLGFTSCEAAQSTLAGIEVLHLLRKGQLKDGAAQGRTPAEQFYGSDLHRSDGDVPTMERNDLMLGGFADGQVESRRVPERRRILESLET